MLNGELLGVDTFLLPHALFSCYQITEKGA